MLFNPQRKESNNVSTRGFPSPFLRSRRLDACRDYSGDEKMSENLRVNAAGMKIAVAVLFKVTALTWEHVKLAHGYIDI